MFDKFKKQNNRFVIEQKNNLCCFTFYRFSEDLQVFNFMYTKQNQRLYFKGNGRHTLDISELFSAVLAKTVGLDTIEPYPALFIDIFGKEYSGIVSKDFIADRKNTEIISSTSILKFYHDLVSRDNVYEENTEFAGQKARRFNNIESHYKAAKIFAFEYSKQNQDKTLKVDPNLLKELKRQQLFYFLSGNEDCYSHNIQYKITKQDDEYILSLCPVFDNSYTFMLKSFKNLVYNSYESDTRPYFEQKVEQGFENVNIPFGIFEKDRYNPSRNSVAIDMANIMSKDKELMEFYQKFKNLDLNRLLTEYVVNNKFDFISEKDIDIATIAYSKTIEQLQRAISYQGFINKGPLSSLKALYNKDSFLDQL